MGKNRITEQLANNETTLDLAFNNLLLIASVINNKELLRWVEREISGYQENDNLPLYRKNEKSLYFVYSGLNGTYPVNNVPMPITYFSEEIRNIVPNVKILDGVKIIERQLAIKDSEWSAVRDCTEYAGDVYMNTGIQCFNIGQVLKKSHYEKVFNNIKVHLMKILLMIEKLYGSLDTAELETRKYDRLKLAEAGKLISTYIASLFDNKADIPNPRISMPAKAPENKQNPDKAQQVAPAEQQQPVMPQMPPQQYQMQQQPVMPQMTPQQYQMQQPPVMPQMPPQQYQMQQQPVMPQMTPQQMYQMQQQQPQAVISTQPASQQTPQQQQQQLPQQQLQEIPPQQQTSNDSVLLEELDKDKPVKQEYTEKKDFKPKEKEQEENIKASASVTENSKKEDAAKAAEIRKDRIPKSLLDYLEEKKSELSKKTE